MVQLVAILINICLYFSTFPVLWKRAIVLPIQKSLQNSDLTNFQPRSVLPVLSKVLEKIVHK